MTLKFLNVLLNLANSTRIARVTEQRMIRKSQGTVGICSRAGKFQLLSQIASDLIHSHVRNRCRLQQPRAIAVELPRLLFQSATVHPIEKAVSKLIESSRLPW
jgi:hypothetical protein